MQSKKNIELAKNVFMLSPGNNPVRVVKKVDFKRSYCRTEPNHKQDVFWSVQCSLKKIFLSIFNDIITNID